MYNVAAMSAEPPPNPGSESGTGEEARSGASSAGVMTEAEIDSPSRLTLRLLGVVCLLTLLPWAGAKVACNLRDSPVRPPPELDPEVIAARPKDTGLELAYRSARGEYRAAAGFATGSLAEELLARAARCEKEPASCEAVRRDADQIRTRAILVSRSGNRATVRTESHGPSGVREESFELERRDRKWVVVGRTPPRADAGGAPSAAADAGP